MGNTFLGHRLAAFSSKSHCQRPVLAVKVSFAAINKNAPLTAAGRPQ
jgi:hypothetical protein